MGVSAGAFGVAFNCDDVAAVVKAKDPNAGAAIVHVPNKFLIQNERFYFNLTQAIPCQTLNFVPT